MTAILMVPLDIVYITPIICAPGVCTPGIDGHKVPEDLIIILKINSIEIKSALFGQTWPVLKIYHLLGENFTMGLILKTIYLLHLYQD